VIESPHSVNAQDSLRRVGLKECARQVHEPICAASGGHAEVSWASGLPKLFRELPGEALPDKTPEGVPRTDAAHTAVLLQDGCELGQTHRILDHFRKVALGDELSCCE
jgi:hypothetical protein